MHIEADNPDRNVKRMQASRSKQTSQNEMRSADKQADKPNRSRQSTSKCEIQTSKRTNTQESIDSPASN